VTQHSDVPKGAVECSRCERLDPRVMVIAVLAFVVCEVATPIEEWPRFVGYAALLLVTFACCRVSLVWVLKRLLLALPFVAAVAVSLFVMRPAEGDAVRLPGVGAEVSGAMLLLLASVAAKATLSVGALSLPVALWDFPTLLRAMQSLRVPRLFLMLMAFMWRYVFLLGSETSRMVKARDSRGARAGLLRRAWIVGSMAGSLFLRSFERAERVGQAMVARGYDGTVHMLAPLRRLAVADVLMLVGLAAALAAIRFA
jgi:cobalt/nickel transport system permease protein